MNRMNQGSGLDKKNTSDMTKHKQFIVDLIIDYEGELQVIQVQKEQTQRCLKEWEEKLLIIHRIRSNNSNLFSPNIKTDDITEVTTQLETYKEKLHNLESEQKKIFVGIERLNELIKIIPDHCIPQNDVGLNILQAQEQDRQRIARDLHDSTVQNLTGLVHKVELCTRLIDIDSTRAKLELAAMTSTVKSVINEMREIIYDLKPMTLEDLGLVVTVERFIKQLMMSHDIKIYLKHNREIENVLPVINLSLFRVIQEACNNVIKHAKAKRIDISINYYKDKIKVLIKDDGIGFDLENLKEVIPDRKSGYGLSIMKERIFLLSGTMEIQSVNKSGTTIDVSVPLINRKGDNHE